MKIKIKDLLMLTAILVGVVLLCIFFISQNSSKTLLYGENGGKVPEKTVETAVSTAETKESEGVKDTLAMQDTVSP